MSRRVGRLMGSVIVLLGLLGVGVLSHPKTSRRPSSTPMKHILNDHGWRSWVLDTLSTWLSITVLWSHFKSFPVRIRRPRAVPLRPYPVSLPQCCNGAARPILTAGVNDSQTTRPLKQGRGVFSANPVASKKSFGPSPSSSISATTNPAHAPLECFEDWRCWAQYIEQCLSVARVWPHPLALPHLPKLD